METNLLTKQRVLQVLNNLPEEFTTERLEYECYLINSIERELQDVKAGRVLTVEEGKKRIDEITSGGTRF
ncbi:hypothetical protein EZS27_025462 [termite gut metagenome]|uniref:Addiction module component n=1 Tax=termite gut metagenome TaxID=433724 RepID=A0A5J4QXN6_9ZZZZ